MSYCRKKRQRTLHRLKQLPGPARSAAPFSELYLAATAGALTANTVTQTAEYYLVTQNLLAEQAIQQQQVLNQQQQALLHLQSQLLAHLQHGQQRLLQALGVPPEPLPNPRPAGGDVATLSTPLLPAVEGDALAWPLMDDFGPYPLLSAWSPGAAEDADFGPVTAPTPAGG